jgi:hypothetical protein
VTVLEKGSTGQEVTNLQVALNSHLPTVCPPLVVDGIFGPKTKARTIEFQKQYELLVDGIVGPQTHQALYTFVQSVYHLLVVSSPVKQTGSFSPGAIGLVPPLFPRPERKHFPFPVSPRQLPLFRARPQLLDVTKFLNLSAEIGFEPHFRYLPKEHKKEFDVTLVGNITHISWTKPIRDRLMLGLGAGFFFELLLKRHPEFDTSVQVFGKLQLVEWPRLPKWLDIPVQLDVRLTKPFLGPRSFSATIGAGPEFSLFRDRLKIAIGTYFQYSVTKRQHALSFIPGVSINVPF